MVALLQIGLTTFPLNFISISSSSQELSQFFYLYMRWNDVILKLIFRDVCIKVFKTRNNLYTSFYWKFFAESIAERIFKNRFTVAKVMGKRLRTWLFWLTVYNGTTERWNRVSKTDPWPDPTRQTLTRILPQFVPFLASPFRCRVLTVAWRIKSHM